MAAMVAVSAATRESATADPPPAAKSDETAAACPNHLATIEPDGIVSSGSKERVRQAARAGLPLRIGWHVGAATEQRRGVDHWADAAFVTEFGDEVFAQLADIQKQTPQGAHGRIALGAGRWTGLLGTNGALEGFFEGVPGDAPSPVKVKQTWCVDPRACASPTWRVLYRHDADGRPVAGSKDALFDAVRRGRPIRLIWGVRVERAGLPAISVEHAADPVFVKIMSGGELFAQLPEHVGQASYFEPDQARFDAPGVMWRGLMGTTGAFDAVLVDRGTGREVKRLPQRAAIAWLALAPDPLCDAASPVPLAVPGGVRRADPTLAR
jgi:hypothetical protein